MKGHFFFAKILLFGEYGIINDSKGLSIPYNYFRGKLKFTEAETDATRASHRSLIDYTDYLKTLSTDLLQLDWKRLLSDLDHKLYFDSSIPQGYGVGSSGALVAAFYDRYGLDKISPDAPLTAEKFTQLKIIFAAMESYFHRQSSGLDPLNSYLSLPLLIHSKDKIETTGLPEQNPEGKGAVFLLDTGRSGETAPMVSLFKENMKKEGFSKMMREEFTQMNDRCVESFLKGNMKSFFGKMKPFSSLVLKYFKPMIPAEFQPLWRKGLETNIYFFKLCGSGGGGYMLGFTLDLKVAKKALEGYPLDVVYHF